MQRKRFILVAVISLLLCLAVAWVWRYPRSSGGVRHAIMDLPAGGHVLELSEVSDQLILGLLPADHRQIEARTPPAGSSSQPSVWGIPGVCGVMSVRMSGEWAVGVIAADWFLVVLTALLPLGCAWRWIASNVRRRVQARRARLGLCVRCAYDLRGTPGQCPECGMIPEPAAPQSPHNPPLERTAAAV
jgi:hypothetical protein